MQKLKEEIDRRLADHFAQHPFWKALAAESPEGTGAVRRALLAPGKRLRPMLFCLACRAAGREPFPELAPVALALELAHSFILIHDDIIDRSAFRRGAPTLPARMDQLFAAHPADGFRGSDFALVTGDLLYTLAIESLLQAEADDARTAEALRLFTRAALDTGRGALLEMRAAQKPVAELTTAEIEEVYALKTGRYTFALPLELAACFTGTPAADDGFWRSAGIAFQLGNDLKELLRWQEGGPPPDDLRDGRRIWALVHAGSPEALREPDTLVALEGEMERHARRALERTEDAGLRGLLQTVLSDEGGVLREVRIRTA